MPTTLPSNRFTTGTVFSCSANRVEPRWPGRNEPPPPATRGRPAVMAPELSLAWLSPSACWRGTIAATLPPPDEPSSSRSDGHFSSSDSRSR